MRWARCLVIGLSFLTTACLEGADKPSTRQSAKVSISPSPSILVVNGASLQLEAKVSRAGSSVKETGFTWSSEDPSIVSVSAQGLVLGHKIGVSRVFATTSDSFKLSSAVTIGVVSNKAGAADLRFSGNAVYEDRLIDNSGFTGEIPEKPIRYAVIEAISIDGFKVVGRGATDSSGDFSFTVNNAGQRAGVYLRLLSRTDSEHAIQLEIRDNDISRSFLSYASSKHYDDSDVSPFSVTENLSVSVSSGVGGAFNLLDVLATANEVVQASGPCLSPFEDCIPPLATVYWQPGSSEGTYYDDRAKALYIIGGGGSNRDRDEYDDAVVAHEYGHFILGHFARDDSPGGFHTLGDSTQDIRLSWSEGWASYFSHAVRNSSAYVDTAGSGVLIAVDIEDYSSASNPILSNLIKTSTNELSVAGVLWDVFDGVDDAESDALAFGFREPFQLVINFSEDDPTTLETFWLEFESAVATASSAAAFQEILKLREIAFFADATEGSELVLSLDVPQAHTLYGAGSDPRGDVDVIPFAVSSGQAYRVRTFDLTNGADTTLRIKDPSGIVITSNDNPEDEVYTHCSVSFFTGVSNCPRNDDTLASSVSFTWSQGDATLSVEVSRSEVAPDSAGTLGSYFIEATTETTNSKLAKSNLNVFKPTVSRR